MPATMSTVGPGSDGDLVAATYDPRMNSTPAVDLPPAHTLAWLTVRALRQLGDSGKVEEINETAVELDHVGASASERKSAVPSTGKCPRRGVGRKRA